MSEAYVKTRNAIVFSLMMIFMAQVGYLSILNPWYETLDEEYVPAKSTALPSGLAFSAMTCGYEVMSDVQGDNGNNDALDIVGNASYPAVQTASNATSVFIQLRLDGTPTNSQGTSLQSFMWGMEFDTDGNKSTYEHLVSYYGSGSDSLKIYNNTVTTTADSPTDSADSVSVELTPASDYWNSSVADSSFGGDDDYLLTMILPWDVLEDHDMDRNGTPSFNWFGTSTSNQNLNGDFACHDGNNDGAPQLTTTASDPVPLDSARRFTFPGGVWSGSSTVYYVNGTQYDSLTFAPTSIPDGATFEVDPTLPSGLSVNASGVLSGIPTQIMSGGTYTMYANSTVDGVAFSATANIILNVAPGEVDFELWQSVVDGAKLPLNAAMNPITFGYVEGEDASAIYGNGSYWNITEAYSSSGFGNRISQLDGYDVMFDDDVIMFNDNNDLYMHNLNNGTTWKELTHSGGFYYFLYVIDDVLLFDSYSSSTVSELWAYNTSNGTKWRVGGAGFELPSFTCCGTGWPVTGTKSFPPSPLKVGDDFYLYGEDTNGPGEGLYRFNGASFELEFLSNSTTPSTSFSNLKNLIHHNGTVYFTAQEFGTYRWDLYKHTIATNQTSMLHDVTGGSTSSSNYGFEDQVTMVSDDIIAFVHSGLWAYNITSNTSYQVNSSLGGNLNEAVVVDDVVYFSAGVDRELYAYNLSSNATWMVKDINTNSGTDGFISNEGPDILVRDGKLYFIGLTGWQDINNNYRIWVHDTQENATYSIDNGYNYGRRASWFHGFTRDQLFYYYDATSGWDELLMYDISTNETSKILNQGSGSGSGQYWALMDDVFVYQNRYDDKMYAYSPEELSVVSFDAVAGASCSIYPSLPAGLSLNQGNCTVSGTPTSVTSTTTYTLTATISGTIYSAMFWLATDYLPLSPSVSGVEAAIGEPIEPITFGMPPSAEAGDGGWDAPYNEDFKTILTGDYHTCAVLKDGSVACWGDNSFGQIGKSSTSTDYPSPEVVDLPSGSHAVAVPMFAADHSCALLSNSSLYCWGNNVDGELGLGSTASNHLTPTYVPLPSGRTVASIHADHDHACVVLDDGSALCTGYNLYRQLGIGNTTTMREYTPVTVLPSGAKVIDMALTHESTCALLDDGGVMCWGNNAEGELGQGNTNTYTSAKTVQLPEGNIAAIEGSHATICALYENGSVACWGDNSPHGERGVGTSTSNTSIAGFTNPMPGNLSAISLSSGDETFCVILSNGSVACWGDATAAYSTTSSNVLEPTLIPWPHGSVRAVDISVGWYHACVLLENGSMWCWGQSSQGQLGDGTTNAGPTFVDIGKVAGPPASLSAATCSVQPSLPAGLTLTQGTCTISGTPTTLSTNQTYTIYANTSQGTSRGQIWIGVNERPLFPSQDGANLLIDQTMTNITFQYNASAASGSGSGSGGGASQSSFVNNIGLRTTSGSATQSTNGAAITPIEFSLEWDNFTTPSSLSSSEKAIFPFDHSVNDTTSTPIENSTLSASNLTYDRHGREMHALDEYVKYEANKSEMAISSNRISLSLWIKPTNVGTEQQIIANNPQFHLRMNANGSLNFRIRQDINGAWNDHYSSTQLEDDTWYHIGVSATYSSTYTVNFYVNGSLDVQRTSSGTEFTSTTGAAFALMKPLSDMDALEGILDDLYVYDAVLSASNFSTLMDVGEITWDVSPSLPAGLSLDTFTGTITGTPSTSQAAGQYTVYANSSSTSYSRTFNLNLNSGSVSSVTGASSCSTSPSLPAGLSIDSSTCTISGTPTVETSRTTYTVTANISNLTYQVDIWLKTSHFATLSSLVDGAALELGATMTPISLDYFLTNAGNASMEDWVGYGNDSTWQVDDIYPSYFNSNPGQYMSIVVGDTIYFDATTSADGKELWAHDTSNDSTWQVADIYSGSSSSNPGQYMSIVVGDTIYFDAANGSGIELWAHDTSNDSTWQVADISSGTSNSNPGEYMSVVVGDTIYFDATTGSGTELWAHDTSNDSTWQVADIYSGTSNSYPGEYMSIVVGDTIYFDAWALGGVELWAHDTSNDSTWRVADIRSGPTGSYPGYYMSVVVGDTIYFDAITGSGRELWAHDTSNDSTWQVVDIYSSSSSSTPGQYMAIVVGDTIYFDAATSADGRELWAHDTSNDSTWQVADIYSGSSNSDPGQYMSIVVGDTIYFDAQNSAYGTELWAHDTSNDSTWRATDIAPSTRHSNPGQYMSTFVGDTIYFSASHNTGSSSTSTGVELWAHQPAEIQYISLEPETWEIEPLLPDGMSLSSGSISGTPSVYASNQTYTVYVNQSNYSFTLDLWFTVDTDNPHTVVENVTIDPIGFHPPFWNGTTTWTVSPALPSGLSIDSATGEITGAVNGTLANTTFTVTATHSGSAIETFTFNLESLADYDGDGLPNELPPDYDTNDPPTSGLVADDDDDGDGLPDANETDTGTYVNESDTGTDPLDPDTDDDGVCDGPNAISGVCVAGPDTSLGPIVVATPIVLVNNTAVAEIDPFYAPTGATYGLSPTLPSSLQFDASNGSIWGTPDMVMANTSYTMWANVSGGASMQWTFYLTVLDDFDGDGLPDVLPGDYNGSEDPIRSAPGLEEDLDDDADGLPDTNETDTGIYVNESDTGTNPLDPDTDDDGICDGPNAVPGVCIAGPDTDTGPPVIATPIVLVNNTDVAEIDPFFVVSGATYSLSPSLPTSLQFDASNGSIWGTPDMVMANTSYTMWANLSNGVSVQWTFYLSVLDDLDGDGLPDVLPGDYNGSVDPIRSAPGLEEDLDDDGDGYNDTAETDTRFYLDGNNTGTDPRDPDTDDDGICDGPNAVPGICAAGPDMAPFGPTPTVVAVNNTAIPNVQPYYVGSGLSYQIMPSLPAGLSIDPATGVISGTPTQTIGNTTFTVFANHTNGNSYSWDFTIEVLEDTDGDGDPDTLPIDYDGNEDSIRGPPGLTEDLDDDNDGLPDLNETDTGIWNGEGDTGTDPLNPDTDGDGFCDGPASEVYDRLGNLVCRGPDPDPHDPTDPLDTDGDMYPDDDPDGEGGLEADDDDDNDGYPDISEDACNSDSKNATSIPEDMDGDAICDGDDLDMDGDGIDNLNETGLPIGTDPENPDTDGDGVCDGPESPVTSNCTAGPDAFPLDPSASKDTDGDGKPDDLVPGVNSTSDPALIEDLDDDDDGWDDLDEIACGTDSLNETDIPVDLNGDGLCDVLDDDWDDDGIPNANETNTSIYVNETDTGTDPWNPDTDGDGYCDGPVDVMNGSEVVCVAGPDPYPNDPTQPVDTDGDGLPDELPDDYDGELIEDTDDDGDGVEDVDDLYPLNPGADTDTDGDGRPDEVREDVNTDPSLIEDLFDDDAEDDGWSDLDEIACGTDPQDDTDEPGDIDGDGICDALDTEDNRDDLDGDGWSNVDELLCGTDENDDSSVPKDSDLDGICNAFDPPILTYTNPNATRQYNTSDMWILLNESIVLTPFLDGILADTWEINGTLPDGLNFTGQARSSDGTIFGTPTELMNMTTYFITASNSLTGESISFMLNLSVVEDTDLDGLPDNDPDGPEGIIEGDLDDDNDGWSDEIEIRCETNPSDQSDTPADLIDENNECLEDYVGTTDPSDKPFNYGFCFLPLLLLLALLLFVLFYRDRVVLVGPEPEHTFAEPKFESGQGTASDPFVIKSPKPIKHGESVVSKELITFTNMSPNIKFPISDLGSESNRTRFKMIDERGSEEGVFEVQGDEEGTSSIRIKFDDTFENTREGGTFQGLLKIGLNSVYVMWEVEVKPDKEYLKELKKQEQEAEKQRKKEEAEAKKKAEADAKAEKEAKAKAEAEAEAKAKAEEEAAAAALLVAKKEEEEAEKKAKKEAEAEAKAKKESAAAEKKAKAEAEKEAKAKAEEEAKAKAEEEAAAALLIAKKEEEEAEAKAKAEEEAKAKAEAEAKAKVAAVKPATKEAKKEEEIERVKERAKTIDFKVLGKATTSEVKEEVKKGAETLNVGDASSFEDQGEATISDEQGSMVISWQGKDGNTLTGVKGVTRVIKTRAVLIARNDLQAIKGVGPFIEEKLNALGIYTWRQVANMNTKLEDQVNQAIEFFPGRVKRDQWVAQAKILLGEDAKLDEKALKQAEELARVEAKAESIDFGVLGVASAADKNDLQKIKGIGPFIEEKLNALGIFTFDQIAKMTSKIEEEVNVAIEFFPGRVKRDEWAKQAKELAKGDKK